MINMQNFKHYAIFGACGTHALLEPMSVEDLAQIFTLHNAPCTGTPLSSNVSFHPFVNMLNLDPSLGKKQLCIDVFNHYLLNSSLELYLIIQVVFLKMETMSVNKDNLTRFDVHSEIG